MKKLKSKIAMLLIVTAFAFSCKKNESGNVGPDIHQTDSMDMSVDTVGPALDSSATLNTDVDGKNGTTGATGEGSTGSGTAGSTQKGNQSVRTDSIQK